MEHSLTCGQKSRKNPPKKQEITFLKMLNKKHYTHTSPGTLMAMFSSAMTCSHM